MGGPTAFTARPRALHEFTPGPSTRVRSLRWNTACGSNGEYGFIESGVPRYSTDGTFVGILVRQSTLRSASVPRWKLASSATSLLTFPA
jgi:hypothetical protein